MKALVTGINGFVGAYLEKELEQNGFEVIGIDLEKTKTNRIEADLRNYEETFKALEKTKPDVIFHLAGVSRVDFKDPRTLYEININGTLNLLTAAIHLERLPKFIFISSSQVYGNAFQARKAVNESCLVKPVNHYGASKAAGESLSLVFHKEYGLPLTILRPFNHTGKGQSDIFLVGKLAKVFKNKEREVSLGNTHIYRDLLDVRDVVRAYTQAALSFQDGEILNVASEKAVSFNEIIQLFEKIQNYKINIKETVHLKRSNEIDFMLGSAQKIKESLNWQPRFDFEDTLKWMLE